MGVWTILYLHLGFVDSTHEMRSASSPFQHFMNNFYNICGVMFPCEVFVALDEIVMREGFKKWISRDIGTYGLYTNKGK